MITSVNIITQQVLQQHCDYFDRDHDGVIWPSETWSAISDWGWSWPLVAYATFIIHFWLSYPSCDSLLPDPCFRIYLKGVNRNKHGSDSMSFDSEGRFRPQHFEDMFAKYDKDNKGGLTKREIWIGLRGQVFAFDLFGASAAALECEFAFSESRLSERMLTLLCAVQGQQRICFFGLRMVS